MSSGGGTTTTNTVQKSDPWAPAQPYLQDIMSQAQQAYNSQQGQTGYAPFNTVATPSANTQLGLDLTAQRALAGSPVTDAAQSSITGILNGGSSGPGDSTLQSLAGGYNDPGTLYAQMAASMKNPALGIAGNLAQNGPNMAGNGALSAATNGAYTNAAIPGLSAYTSQNPSSNPASQYLSDLASPDSINPYLTAQYNAASKPVIDSINAQFSQAGRTGSAANQSVLAQNLGDLSSNIFANGYQNAVNNRLAATGQIQSAYDNSANRGLQANSLLGQYSGQDIANRLNAAQNLNSGNLAAYGAQGTAAGLLGGLSESEANRQLQAGSQLSANALNQANVMGNAANNLNTNATNINSQKLSAAGLAPTLAGQDYTDLQNLLNVGGAQDAQSQAQIQDLLTRWQYQQQQPWNILQQYGGAVSGLGGLMPASSSGTSAQTQPSQSMIPQLLGTGIGIASLFSDRDLKTDIKRVGTSDNGLPLYLFRYKGDSQTRLGLMAQDVEKTNPAAVEIDPSGFKRVNYQLALAA